jgi:hypothetical protein
VEESESTKKKAWPTPFCPAALAARFLGLGGLVVAVIECPLLN